MVTKDPFISVKLELTLIVVSLVLAVWLLGGLDTTPAVETLALFALAGAGALRLVLRTRRLARLQREEAPSAKHE